MNDNARVRANLITSIIGYVVSIVIGLVLPRFFVLSFGSEVNGLLNSINQFIVYLGLFEAGIGTTTLQALFKPLATNDRNKVNAIMNAAGGYYLKTGLFYLIGLIVLCFSYALFVETEVGFSEVVGIVFFIGAINVFNFWIQGKYVVLLQAEGKAYIINMLNSISSVLTGLLKVILLVMRVDLVIIFALSFIISISTMILLLLYVKSRYKWLDRTIPADYQAVNQKNYVLVHQISALIFFNTDIIILTAFCGLKVVSVYSMYMLVTSQLSNVLRAIPNSFEFSLGQLFQVNKVEYRKQVDIVESFFSVAYHTFFSVALFLFIPFMRLYTAGITDINYIDYKLALLFVGMELLSNARSMMSKTVNFAGHFKLTTSRSIAESVINLTVSIVAVQFWGIYGTLLGTIVALLYRTNDFIIYGNRRLLGRSPMKTYLIHLLNLFVLVLLQYVYKFFVGNIKSFFSFILYGIVMVSGTFVIMTIVQIVVFRDVRQSVLSFMRRV